MPEQRDDDWTEHPFFARPARRIKAHAAAKSPRRKGEQLLFLDLEKWPFRVGVYGETLFASLLLLEWNPSVKSYWLTDGKAPITEDDPAYDDSSPIVSIRNGDQLFHTTCVKRMPKSSEGKKRLKDAEARAVAEGALHETVTHADVLKRQREIDNYLTMNQWLHKTPEEFVSVKREARFVSDVLHREPTTTIEDLKTAEGIAEDRLLGAVGRLLCAEFVVPQIDLTKRVISEITKLAWTHTRSADNL